MQDDTGAVGQQQSESATNGTSADPDSTGSLTLNPTLYSSKQQWLSNTTVNAVDFDLFSYMLPQLRRRLDKSQESVRWVGSLKTNGNCVGITTAGTNVFTYAEWRLEFEHLRSRLRTVSMAGS